MTKIILESSQSEEDVKVKPVEEDEEECKRELGKRGRDGEERKPGSEAAPVPEGKLGHTIGVYSQRLLIRELCCFISDPGYSLTHSLSL